jgi:hypothetical protein
VSEQGDQGDPNPGPDRATRLRWVARLGIAAVGLWFLVDGLRGIWPDAGTGTRVVIVVVTVVVVAIAALAAFRLARRDRQG